MIRTLFLSAVPMLLLLNITAGASAENPSEPEPESATNEEQDELKEDLSEEAEHETQSPEEESQVVPADTEELLGEEESVDTKGKVEAGPDQRRVVGWVERIRLEPEGLLFDAKLTPGSEGNVLHAENITEFTRNKKKWLRFTLNDRMGRTKVLERRIVDTTRYRTTSGKVVKRYQIKLGFCLGSRYLEFEFGLADRSEFEHEARIGRDALAGHFVIDPGMTKTTTPVCVVNAS